MGNVFTTDVFVNGGEQFIPVVTQEGIIEIGLSLSDISTVAGALNSIIPDAVVSDETYVIGEASEGDSFPGNWSEYELLS